MLKRALEFDVLGKRERERLNVTWKRQVEEHIDKIGINKEDATDRPKWRNDVYKLSRKVNLAISVDADKIAFKIVGLSFSY